MAIQMANRSGALLDRFLRISDVTTQNRTSFNHSALRAIKTTTSKEADFTDGARPSALNPTPIRFCNTQASI